MVTPQRKLARLVWPFIRFIKFADSSKPNPSKLIGRINQVQSHLDKLTAHYDSSGYAHQASVCPARAAPPKHGPAGGGPRRKFRNSTPSHGRPGSS